jgi:hypothetical protein
MSDDFQAAPEAAKVAVYKKALFRDRIRQSKASAFHLERRPDALSSVFQLLNRREFTLNALNSPFGFSRTGQF